MNLGLYFSFLIWGYPVLIKLVVLCGSSCIFVYHDAMTMSPLKRATVKGGNSKGKDHVINVDDLSPRLKRNRSLSRVYDPNKFRTYAAFQTHEKYFREAKPLLERVLY